MTEQSTTLDQKIIYEPLLVNGMHLLLPVELIRNRNYFDEIFSMNTWENVLTEDDRIYLRVNIISFLLILKKKFLPRLHDKQKDDIIKDLFSRKQNFLFGNPIDKFLDKLIGKKVILFL